MAPKRRSAAPEPTPQPVPAPPATPSYRTLRQQFEALSGEPQGVAVGVTAATVFLVGFLFGWRRRKSAEQRAAAAAAQTDKYLVLNRNVSEARVQSLNQSWSAEKTALLAKHAAEKSALETAMERQEKQAARRLQEVRLQLESAHEVLKDKERVLSTVWGATEALNSSVVAALAREVAALRGAQQADSRIRPPRTDESPAQPASPSMPSRPKLSISPMA